jgi:succinate dehydrogenase flavin-adding protein (antitoxin of CptAB toxin-antitoxin module)
MIQAPCQGIQLLLSAIELAEFNSLLDCADTELQSLRLISLFDQ